MPRPCLGCGPWNRTPTVASRGLSSRPGTDKPAINPDNETVTGMRNRNTPVGHRHLKLLVLGPGHEPAPLGHENSGR